MSGARHAAVESGDAQGGFAASAALLELVDVARDAAWADVVRAGQAPEDVAVDAALVQDAQRLAEQSPTQVVDAAVAAARAGTAAPTAEVPSFDALVGGIRERDDIVQANMAVPSETASSVSPAMREAWSAEEWAEEARTKLSPVTPTPGTERVYRWLVQSKHMEQEFLVLSTTLLSELRDAMFCMHDCIGSGPAQTSTWFVLIDDRVYTSEPRASEALVHWLRRHHPQASATLQVNGVADVRFSDLEPKLRLGVPCLLVHQGNCEHILELQSAHWLHHGDVASQERYPMNVFSTSVKHATCMACDKLKARFECFDHGFVDANNPCKVCAACFRQGFYDREGNLRPEHASLRVRPHFYEP
ncbi:snRNA-activating protein complex subunit 3 (SNAPc subunit 3) (Small nuclear RNA-activating complex polypeptide 3), partial [Durusdinium trenchii]